MNTKRKPYLRNIGGEGVTVSVEHRVTGEPYTIVSPDDSRNTKAALRRALVCFDPAEWRVTAISTPQTIYDDITSARSLSPNGRWDTDRHDWTIKKPERSMLSGAGLGAFL